MPTKTNSLYCLESDNIGKLKKKKVCLTSRAVIAQVALNRKTEKVHLKELVYFSISGHIGV